MYRPLEMLEKEFGFEVTFLPVDSKGHISLEDLRKAVRKDTILVSIMQVNNEMGAIEPIEEIGKLVKSINPETYVHTDAIQSMES